MDKNLLELVKQAQTNGTKKVISETKVEEYTAIPNSIALSVISVPFETPKLLERSVSGAVTTPCVATSLEYKVSAFKSQARESLGDLTKGCSIEIHGYDVVTDAHGCPVLDENGNYKPILSNEDGSDKEPFSLMEFRPQFGVNYNKQSFARLKDTDMLNLVPNRGVPRKVRTVQKADGSESISDSVDWTKLSGLQAMMEKPLLNAKLDDNKAFIEYLGHIPVASNAPSKQATANADAKAKVAPSHGSAKAKDSVEDKDPFATE